MIAPASPHHAPTQSRCITENVRHSPRQKKTKWAETAHIFSKGLRYASNMWPRPLSDALSHSQGDVSGGAIGILPRHANGQSPDGDNDIDRPRRMGRRRDD